MLKHLTAILLLLIPISLSAASNEETIEFIISDYQQQCEKLQEDFRDVDYDEGDPVLAELELSEDNIYEITVNSNGKTATVLHAYFSCTNVGYAWCGTSGCDSYVIVDGVSYTSRGGKPMSIDVGGWYVVLIPRRGSACHNSLEIGTSNAAPCYTAAVWDSSANTFSSNAYNDYVLKISQFEP